MSESGLELARQHKECDVCTVQRDSEPESGSI